GCVSATETLDPDATVGVSLQRAVASTVQPVVTDAVKRGIKPSWACQTVVRLTLLPRSISALVAALYLFPRNCLSSTSSLVTALLQLFRHSSPFRGLAIQHAAG